MRAPQVVGLLAVPVPDPVRSFVPPRSASAGPQGFVESCRQDRSRDASSRRLFLAHPSIVGGAEFEQRGWGCAGLARISVRPHEQAEPEGGTG